MPWRARRSASGPLLVVVMVAYLIVPHAPYFIHLCGGSPGHNFPGTLKGNTAARYYSVGTLRAAGASQQESDAAAVPPSTAPPLLGGGPPHRDARPTNITLLDFLAIALGLGATAIALRQRLRGQPWVVAQYGEWPDEETPPLDNKQAFYLANRVPLPNNVQVNKLNKLKFTKTKPSPEEPFLTPPGLEDMPEVIHPVDHQPAPSPQELVMVRLQIEELARAQRQGRVVPVAAAPRGFGALRLLDDEGPLQFPGPGGSMVIPTSSSRVVVQMATSDPDGATTLQYQAEGLRRLSPLAPSLRIPQCWGVGEVEGGPLYLIREHVPAGKARRDYQRRLGRGLAELHLAEVDYPSFGFPMDGVVGGVPQPNNVQQEPLDWVEFWRKCRLGDQLQRIRERFPKDAPIQKYGRLVLDRLPELYTGIDVAALRPCLLHGNLEAANIGVDPQGHPFLGSPAAYYGHNEADLGSLRLSGGYTDDFWQAYHQLIPKAGGYSRRVPLYKLHYCLNAYLRGDVVCREHAVDLMKQILDSLHVYYD